MSQSSLTISLNLAHNQLTGSLPSEVGALKNLGNWIFLRISCQENFLVALVAVCP